MADNSSESISCKKRDRVDSDESTESQNESPAAKRLRTDLFDILVDDVDFAGDRDAATQDLASVMKIFEEEISPSAAAPPAPEASDSGESQPDLGYLLEASDDELGLPPTTSPSAEEEKESVDVVRDASEAVGLGHMWVFDDDIPSYDALEFGIPENNAEEESIVFGGLFDYPDFVCGAADFSWRQESLSAL